MTAGILAIGCAVVSSCGRGGDGADPVPGETPAGWTEVRLAFSGANNPNSNRVCAGPSGDDAFAGWTGFALALQGTGGALRLGDPAYAGSTDFAWTECRDAAGACVGSAGGAAWCGISYSRRGTSLGGHPQSAFFHVRVPAAQWGTGTITFTEPAGWENTAGSYAFGLVQIDVDEDGILARDPGSGEVLAPDVESFVGVSGDGSQISLSAAGVLDGEAVAIQGTSTISLIPVDGGGASP